MEKNAGKTGQSSSLRAIRWGIAVERQRLSAAIGDAMREVMNAERLLAADGDVDGAAARRLSAWTAILDSRITRFQSFNLRHHNELAAETPPSVESDQKLFIAPTVTSLAHTVR
jgi:hypothetical protein